MLANNHFPSEPNTAWPELVQALHNLRDALMNASYAMRDHRCVVAVKPRSEAARIAQEIVVVARNLRASSDSS